MSVAAEGRMATSKMAEAEMLVSAPALPHAPEGLPACIVMTNLYSPFNDEDTPDMTSLEMQHYANDLRGHPYWPNDVFDVQLEHHTAGFCTNTAMASDLHAQPLETSQSCQIPGMAHDHGQHSYSGPMSIASAGSMPAAGIALVRSCRARRSRSLSLRADALKASWNLKTTRNTSHLQPPSPPLQQQQQVHNHQAAAAPMSAALGRSLDSALPLWDGDLMQEDSDAIMAEILGEDLDGNTHSHGQATDSCSQPLPVLHCLQPMQPATDLDACSPVENDAGSPDHIFSDCPGVELAALMDVSAAGSSEQHTVCGASACCQHMLSSVAHIACPQAGTESGCAGVPSSDLLRQQRMSPFGRSPSSSASDASMLFAASADRSAQDSPRLSAVSGQPITDSQAIAAATATGLEPSSNSVASEPTAAGAAVAAETAPGTAASPLPRANTGAEGGPPQQSASAMLVTPAVPAAAAGRAASRAIKAEPGSGSRSPRSVAGKASAAVPKVKAKAGTARKAAQPKTPRVVGKVAAQAAVVAAVTTAAPAAAAAPPAAASDAQQPAAAPAAASAPTPINRPMPPLSGACSAAVSPLAAVQALFEWHALSHRVVSAAAALNQATAWDLLTLDELERFLAKMGRTSDAPATGAERREALIRDIKQCILDARMGKQAPA